MFTFVVPNLKAWSKEMRASDIIWTTDFRLGSTARIVTTCRWPAEHQGSDVQWTGGATCTYIDSFCCGQLLQKDRDKKREILKWCNLFLVYNKPLYEIRHMNLFFFQLVLILRYFLASFCIGVMLIHRLFGFVAASLTALLNISQNFILFNWNFKKNSSNLF